MASSSASAATPAQSAPVQRRPQYHATPGPSQTTTESLAGSDDAAQTGPAGPSQTLHLRGHARAGRSVQWAEGVVDNEGLNRKKSKVCCIYHRPHAIDESSEDDSSASSDSSDSDGGRTGRADADHAPRNPRVSDRRQGRQRRRHAPDCPSHGHEHDNDNEHDGEHKHDSGNSDNDSRNDRYKGKKPWRRPSPNAYEKMPRYNKPSPGPGV